VSFDNEGPRGLCRAHSKDQLLTKSVQIARSRPLGPEPLGAEPLGTQRPTSTTTNSRAGRQVARSRDPRRRDRPAGPHRSLASFDTSFVGERAVLTVWGELDLLAESEFSAYLRAAIDCGHGSVELDLSQLNFLDTSALGVIAQGAALLRADGRSLTIRSPAPVVVRTLEITGLAELLRVEPAGRLLAELDTESLPRRTALPGSRFAEQFFWAGSRSVARRDRAHGQQV
jgi:anti-sigma B factor antagonist